MPVWDYGLYPLRAQYIGHYQAYGLQDFYLTPIYRIEARQGLRPAVSIWLAAASGLLLTFN